MNAAKPNIVVFLAHYFDAEVERRFFKLQREASSLCDVALFVEGGVTVPPALQPFAQAFDFSKLRGMAKSVIGEKIAPGNCHLRDIDFSERFPGYRYYWFVEYDVVYTGDWGSFLASFADDESDLLAAHVRTLAADTGWAWRASLSTGPDGRPSEDWIIAFQAIHRISARGLQVVQRRVQDGWTGHFEALVPTALAVDGLTVSDLSSSGAWTPKERIGRHYFDWDASLYLGTLRYRPPIRWHLIPSMLYHPCKTSLSARDPGGRRRYARAARRKAISFAYLARLLELAFRSRLRAG